MKARLPQEYQNKGAGGMNSMIKQAQKMQEDIRVLQEELDHSEFTTTAAGGMIELTMTGGKELREIKNQSRTCRSENIEDLQDAVVAGVTRNHHQEEERTAGPGWKQITGGA